ncbi:EAL domain-containing protein [Pseudomonas sp. NFX224]|uniref:EAL domain-containing protein n=1 Tax=Pseudomonas sp. NFX224 TaxID=3402862 RepID=UPI003AFA3D3A
MKRSKIMRRGILLAALAVIVPLGITFAAGWMLSIYAAHDRLQTLAAIANDRASQTFTQASQALKNIALTDLEPCSPQGIEQMRMIAMNSFSVEAVGYEEDVFACTSWGATPSRSKKWAEDFVTEDGVKVSIDAHDDNDLIKPMLALQFAAFHVLVDPEQFREILLDEGVRLAVGTRQGRLLGSADSNMASFLALVHKGPTHGLKDGFLYTLVAQGNFTVIAAIPRQELLRSLWQHFLYLLPIGLAAAVGLVFVTLRWWRRKLSPLAALERAVQRHEFFVHYQPIIEIETQRCIGVEALVRWRQPNGTLVYPDVFIPLAESSGLIEAITDQVINSVFEDLGAMLASDRSLHVALNLAAADVCSGRLIPTLLNEIRRLDVQPAQIWLEVTERSIIDLAPAKITLERARNAGFIVALDDFGTGYSSLQYLQQLPLDVLKIDRSFVEQIGEAEDKTLLVTHVIQMGHALRLTLIAEGVETPAQLNYLRANKVQYVQGWLFAKALDCAQFKQLYLDSRPCTDARII